MPLDHFLPATYIAGFSADTNPVRRQRRVWVADKQAGKIFETAASNVCAINDFYTLESSQFDAPRIVDAQFSGYEGPLANAINHLVAQIKQKTPAHHFSLARGVGGPLARMEARYSGTNRKNGTTSNRGMSSGSRHCRPFFAAALLRP